MMCVIILYLAFLKAFGKRCLMKGSYRNWVAIALGESFLWVNEGLKVKKHVVKKGTVFTVMVIPHFKQ